MLLIMYKRHHTEADIDRLYVNSKGGGRGLLQIEATHKAEIINIAEYLNTKYTEDQFVNIVNSHDSQQPNINSKTNVAAKVPEELKKIKWEKWHKKEGIQHRNANLGESLKKKLERKVAHGQYIRCMDRKDYYRRRPFLWLSNWDMKGDTESEIITA